MATYDTAASLAVSAARSGVLVTGVNLRPPAQGISLSTSATAVSIAYPQGQTGLEFSFSATAGAYAPYTPGPEGSRPIEVKLYDPAGVQVLDVLNDRWGLGWQEDYNDTGSGQIALHQYDVKATAANLASFNIVKFEYDNNAAFGFRIEKKTLDIVKDGDHASKVWRIAGRGLLSMLVDAVVYPEYGIKRITSKQRNFNFSSLQGPWYVPSEWQGVVGVRQDATAGTPWATYPTDWPDPAAEWIWWGNPATHNNPETVFFRYEFEVTDDINVRIMATADNRADIYLDGDIIASSDQADGYGWQRYASYYASPLRKGWHVLAAEVTNDDAGPPIPPQNVYDALTPAYANDSNNVYIGVGYTDPPLASYVDSSGGVDGHYGEHAVDANASTYWLSVGNYLSWTSAFEWVETTFSYRKVTAVTVTPKGGPYLCYLSFRAGSSGWFGGGTIPYSPRSVDAGTRIPYVITQWLSADVANVIYIPGGVDADRVRVTLTNLWDSGLGKYRWRAAITQISVTSERLIPGFNNLAGLLVTVAKVNTAGEIEQILHNSNSLGFWKCKRGARPGWMAQHILHQLMIEAEARGVYGASVLSLGFTPTTDSNGIPWNLPRQELSYNVGADILSVVGSLVETDNFDVWVDAETMTLHAAQQRGRDKSTGLAPLALREGQSIIDFNAETVAPKATRYLVETPWGWTEVADPDEEMQVGRFERLMSLGNAASVDQATQQAAAILSFTSRESTSVTGAHTDSIGPRAYTDYKVGDWILAPDIGLSSPPPYRERLVPYRILSISAAEDEAGNVTFTPELDKEELEEPT